MSSGNPMGLSEISHFGTFQRVGGKAGGFISKKFFHPSSFRNQEKLWAAQTADERDTKKQLELEKRREEERQVEALRKQMYLTGQGSASDFMSSSTPIQEEADSASADKKADQQSALEEEKRRRAMLKHQGKDGRKAPNRGSNFGKLAASRYPEDVFVLNHQSVWGSWYSVEEKRWGFVCCKGMDRNSECPLSGEADADAAASQVVDAGASGATSSKKPRISEDSTGGVVGDSKVADKQGSSDAVGRPEGGLQVRGTARRHADRSGEAGPDEPVDDKVKGRSSLMDLLQASERRSEKRKCEAERTEDTKTSNYLADLLLDPSAGR